MICFFILTYAKKGTEHFNASSKSMKRNLIRELDYAILDDARKVAL